MPGATASTPGPPRRPRPGQTIAGDGRGSNRAFDGERRPAPPRHAGGQGGNPRWAFPVVTQGAARAALARLRQAVEDALHVGFVESAQCRRAHVALHAEREPGARGGFIVGRLQVVSVHHGGEEVARHAQLAGSRGRQIERSHLMGAAAPAPAAQAPATDALLRPLAEYEALVGGRW